ncbi:MAG: hypothetical protein AAGI23_05135 [Bacteroidota bacterium]
MRYLLFLVATVIATNLSAQSADIVTPTPYYVWEKGESKMLGVLYKIEGDSLTVIPKDLFFEQEQRFLAYPNTLSDNFLKTYPLSDTGLKGRRKGFFYFYTILGTVVGAGVGVFDVVRSYRQCNNDPFCNLGLTTRQRSISDVGVVGIGAAAGAVVGAAVGSIKINIPIRDRAKVRQYTIYREF